MGWCRIETQLFVFFLFAGVMGSGHYNYHGGGCNFLCLPYNPVYDKYISGWQGTAAIYGTEYESSYFPGFSHLHNHGAPCAVCYVRSHGSQLMVPATNKCPSGWTREYRGYLMTSHYGHKHASEFVCIDADAEVVQGSHRDTDGALLYFVQSSCGHGLPCKPYISGQELTCVVCTK